MRLLVDNKITPHDIFLSIASGILLTLIFPAFNLSILAWVALVPLLVAIEKKSFLKALFLGWITGAAHFMGLLHWVIVAMTYYGELSMLSSSLLLLLLALYLGLYVGIFGALLGYFRSRYLDDAAVIAPVVWALLEYLRTYLLSGFPWCLLGYSQYRNLLVIQMSDMTGIYGVSFIIIVVNVSLYLISKWVMNEFDSFPVRYTLFTIGMVAVVIFYGDFRKNTIESLDAKSPPLRITLVQGNIDQNQKWESAYLNETLLIYKELTMKAAQDPPALIVWPETAVPCYFTPESMPAHFLSNLSKQLHTPIAFGSLAYDVRKSNPNEYSYYNSAFLISPQKKVLARYDKIHLVPFGEYVPLKPLLPLVEKMVAGIGDFSPGRHDVLFSLPRATFGFLICYEIIFPNLSRKYGHGGVGFLVNITNDAWFGQTGAPYQHFSMAVFRAIENRVSIVRAANSGISGIIEPTGQIQAQTPIFVRTVLQGVIPVNPKPTFYSQYGDIMVALCGITLLGMIISKKMR